MLRGLLSATLYRADRQHRPVLKANLWLLRPYPTPYFQGFRLHLKSKLGVYNFLSSPNAFFFFCFFAPCPFLLYLFSVRALKWRPWNLEFGSPLSTLSCHLSLKNEYEEKYTAASVQGSKKGAARKGRLGIRKGTDTCSSSCEATVPQGTPGRAEEGSREVIFYVAGARRVRVVPGAN